MGTPIPILRLGETAKNAYRGDLGQIGYDHSQLTGNPHQTTASEVSADAAGTAAGAVSAHASLTSDVHGLNTLVAGLADVNDSLSSLALGTAYGPELVVGGTFESLASWSLQNSGNAVVSLVSSPVYTGSHAAKFARAESTAWYIPHATSANITVVPGQTYRLQIVARGDGTGHINYAVYDVTNAAYIKNTTSLSSTASWSTTNYTFVVPVGCVSVQISFYIGGTYASAYLDLCSLKLVSSVASTAVSPRIILPTDITAVVGDELQLFRAGIVETPSPYSLPTKFTCNRGHAYRRYFSYTPVVADVGTRSLTATVTNTTENVLTTASTSIVVVTPTGQPSANKNILCVGDSLTQYGVWPMETYRRLTQSGGTPAGLGYSNLSFVGHCAKSAYPTQGFCGHSGWSLEMYLGSGSSKLARVVTVASHDKDGQDVNSKYTDANGASWRVLDYDSTHILISPDLYPTAVTLPSSGTLTYASEGVHTTTVTYSAIATAIESPFCDFSTGNFSVSAWATRHSITSLDYIAILLGWNSIGNYKTDGYLAATWGPYTTLLGTFVSAFTAAFPGIKVRLIGLQVPSEDGYGALGASYDWWQYVRAVHGLQLALQAYATALGSAGHYLSLASQFDSEHNMPYDTVAVNSRNAATERRDNNCVHPDAGGSYQIADVVYRDLIRTFCAS